MSVMVLLELQSSPENIAEMKSTFREILPDTRKYDGFLELDVYENQDDGNCLVLVEKWESRAHYEAYLSWRTETGALDAVVAMCTQPPSIRFFDNVDA